MYGTNRKNEVNRIYFLSLRKDHEECNRVIVGHYGMVASG